MFLTAPKWGRVGQLYLPHSLLNGGRRVLDAVPGPSGVLPSAGQTRAAETLALLNEGKLRHVFNTLTGWHWWDGQRWKPDGSNKARAALLRTIKYMSTLVEVGKIPAATIAELQRSTTQRGALEIAAHLDSFATELEDMDNEPYLLNCQNGTLDLRTLELRAHSPDDLLTQVTQAAYAPHDPTDTCGPDSCTRCQQDQLWQSFLDTVLPDVEVRQYLQRLVGYSLIGEVLHHIFPLLIGEGGNGKGTFYETVMHALGDYAAPFDSALLIQTRADFKSANAPAPALLGLKGKRLVVTSETEDGARLATAKMKFFTGGDTIVARGMYARAETVFQPSHTMMMVTNFEPLLSSEDGAAWQRITTVPFNVKIRGTSLEIPGFTIQLRDAADAVLAWAVEGLRSYYEIGLAAPAQVLARTQEYHAKTDVIATYIAQRLSADPTPGALVPRTQVWDDWLQWARAEDVEPGKQSDFYDKVAQHYPMSKSRGVRVFRNVALQSDILEDDDDLFDELLPEPPPRQVT